MPGSHTVRRISGVAIVAAVVAAMTGGAMPTAGATAAETRRVLVIPISFDGSTIDIGALNAATFGPSETSLKTFLETVSGGRTTLAGDVLPVEHRSGDPCDFSTWFAAPDLPVPGYDHYIWVSSLATTGSCAGSAGLGYIGGNRVWINSPGFYTYAIRHELGHNLGFFHTTNPDPYDTMGQGCDYQAAYKVQRGWLDNVTTVTTDGTYTVTATHAPGGRVLKIPNPLRDTTYWVEVRDWSRPPLVWDGFACVEPQGVVVRAVPDGGGDTTLVYSGELGYFTNGRAVTLPDTATQLCVQALSPGNATVQVSFAGTNLCGLPPARPVIALAPRSPAVAPSTSVTVTGASPVLSAVSLYDNGTCSGTPIATIGAASLAAGYTLPVPATATTTYSASSHLSGCSDPVTFVVPPTVPVTLADGVLSTTGTAGRDDFFVWTGPRHPEGIEVLIRNTAAFLTPPPGCINKGVTVVSCVVPLDSHIDIDLRGGHDVLVTLLERVSISAQGSGGNDIMRAAEIADPGRVEFRGGAGKDTLYAHNGDAALFGAGGADTLHSGTGTALLDGGGGNDTFEQGAGLGSDVVVGGPGIDTISYASRTTKVKVTLDGMPNDGVGGESDNVGPDVENITGGSGNDRLETANDETTNVVDGGAGNDKIRTFGGDDTIYGGPGDDELRPGTGADIVDGGPGIDTIPAPDPADTVTNVP